MGTGGQPEAGGCPPYKKNGGGDIASLKMKQQDSCRPAFFEKSKFGFGTRWVLSIGSLVWPNAQASIFLFYNATPATLVLQHATVGVGRV
jgi:hypothetical protein